MQPVITDLAGLFHYIFRLHDETKRGMSAALSSCPKCHFAMLETLSTLIAKHGHEGTIYVSQLAEASRQAMPVISRGLRTLEQEASPTPTTVGKRWCASPRRAAPPAPPGKKRWCGIFPALPTA